MKLLFYTIIGMFVFIVVIFLSINLSSLIGGGNEIVITSAIAILCSLVVICTIILVDKINSIKK